MDIRVKRVYEPASKDDGVRVLVDRLWPRGLSKSSLKLDVWLKEIAPSNELRKWYGHDPAKRAEFERRYFRELDQHQDLIDALLKKAAAGRLTLLFSSRELEYNNAVTLKHYLEKKP